MSELVSLKKFVDTGTSDRSNENFQGFLFIDLDFGNAREPVTFFRSDFRNVKIENVKFTKNNFDRADFVNAYIQKSSFQDCTFGTDFINTQFNKVDFDGCILDTCTFDNCFFTECRFRKNNIVNSTNRNTNYAKCIFDGDRFERNSFDDIGFDQTELININIAEMGAYNFTFNRCIFNNLIVDPDYLGSYLIKDSNMEGIGYLYRGAGMEINGNLKDDLYSLAEFYRLSNRYYEAFNSMLLLRHYLKQNISIIEYFQSILQAIAIDGHYVNQLNQLNRIIKVILFYSDSELIKSEETALFIGFLSSLNISFSNIKDRLFHLNNVELLKKTFEYNLFEGGGHIRFNPSDRVYVEITINEEDEAKFKIEFHRFFSEVMAEYSKSPLQGYEILSTRKGSLIFGIIGFSVGLYTLASVLKSVFSKSLEIRMEYSIYQKTIQAIKGSTKSIEEFEKDVKIARRILAKPSNEILEKAKPLAQLMKQFHIFPNALIKGR